MMGSCAALTIDLVCSSSMYSSSRGSLQSRILDLISQSLKQAKQHSLSDTHRLPRLEDIDDRLKDAC